MIKKVTYNTDFSKFFNADYSKQSESCVKYQVNEMEELHDKYGGWPDGVFTEGNTLIHQIWWDRDELDFSDAGLQLGIDVKSFSSIKQPPGHGIPNHLDFFFKLRKDFPDDSRERVRAVIFLEDWEPGQILQYAESHSNTDRSGDIWNNLTDWKAGEGVLWSDNVEHISLNFSFKPKYTLQISGFLN